MSNLPASPSARWRRILQKLSLRFRIAAQVLVSLEDYYPRSRLKMSYAQDGEDLIAWRLLNNLGISHVRYLDIGAHDPKYLSNTALFHLFGGYGMNIEPDPRCHAAFVRQRPRDINLNIGIGPVAGTLNFHRMADASLSTFSSTEADRLTDEQGAKVADVLPVRVATIRDVLEEHRFRPDFLTLDVEGIEMSILHSYDWKRHRPGVVCVETVSYSRSGGQQRDPAPGEWLQSVGYAPAAVTLANSLFVDWKYRRQS